MAIDISVFTIEQYAQVIALWHSMDGIGLSSADSRSAIEVYLQRNPGLSLVASDGDTIVGAVLGGHDGRRGYIHHLAVRESHRRQEIGRQLVDRVLYLLQQEGIQKCHLFVYGKNKEAISFWKQVGFAERNELSMMSKLTYEEAAL